MRPNPRLGKLAEILAFDKNGDQVPYTKGTPLP
jgi:hypothetical protein